MIEFLNDRDRLLYPLVREGKRWNRLSWNAALTQIAQKLEHLKKSYGPESVVIYRGMSDQVILNISNDMLHKSGSKLKDHCFAV